MSKKSSFYPSFLMKPIDAREQFLEAYEKFANAIFRHCYLRVSGRDLAKDLLQETFARTWQYLASGKEISNMRAFLYKVANNLIIEEYRKKRESSLDVLQEKGFEVSTDQRDNLVNSLDAQRVISLLEKLEKKDREVLVMRYIDEFSPKEIALILKESENVVSVRIHRALKKIRQLLAEFSL